MNAYALTGAAIATLVYIPLTVQVWRKQLEQNFATFFLWGLLDAIAAGSIFLKGGNYVLPAMYVVLCGGVPIAILRSRTFVWTWVETMTALLVIGCIIVWAEAGDREATIASTIAVGIAGMPQLVDFWRKPFDGPVYSYVGFTFANGISILAGKNWSIEERFYPTFNTGLTILFVLTIVARRMWLTQRHQAA